ncbi:uncharacterized protein [Temnothorax longispinosus]|uniref:uncharacterized protein n=1 Tax=Temnothorax longispinosus TaxID=300112 RepID=UPI003A9968D1
MGPCLRGGGIHFPQRGHGLIRGGVGSYWWPGILTPSRRYGAPRPPTGRILEVWAAGLGLVVLNTGTTQTCVRRQGGSIVDLTWASPSVARGVKDWRVAEEVESLSDHLFIEMSLSAIPPAVRARRREAELSFPRWAVRKLDTDLLRAAITASLLVDDVAATSEDVDLNTKWIGGIMATACDVAMPRSKPQVRKAAWWRTEEIAELRRASVRAKRRWLRARRRGDQRRLEETGVDYRSAKQLYSLAIKRAKDRSWEELLRALDEVPWGRPYRMVLGKLRTWTPPVTESVEPEFLEEVVNTLFPDDPGERVNGGPDPPMTDWSEEFEVSMDEMKKAAKKWKAGKAPGPDGVPGKAWSLATGELAERLQIIFTKCQHLSRTGPDLSQAQYGFREGRSTIDAIKRIESLLRAALEEGRVLLGVSFDVASAFNTLP